MANLLLGIILAFGVLIPIAYKWELNLKVVSVAVLAIGLFAGLAVNAVTFHFDMGLMLKLLTCSALIIVTAGVVLLIRFYRDPDRVPPERENIIVAPADGVIKYVKHIEKGNIPSSSKGKESVRLSESLLNILPDGQGYLIGIGMSFLDVHVTRAAIAGKVTYLEHIPGAFCSLKRDDAPYRNERLIEVIENDRFKIGLIQIASRLVRRIVAYVREGDELDLGQRMGMIKFGSQVDIVLPNLEDLKVKVSVADQVYAGISVIADYCNK